MHRNVHAMNAAAILALICVCRPAPAAPPEPPVSPDGAFKISLFAAEPEIVTPIGATVDSHGRLMVIESNSHFRPKNYTGAAGDRIRILQDTNGGGKADRIATFYEGTNLMMNLVAEPTGSILVSSRNEIFRLADDGGDTAGQRTSLATLKTKADYPHNGLHGLAADSRGNIYFAIGENFGNPWVLTGADGMQLTGEKGSGAVFRMDSQGRNLHQVAHGFWNPFGLGFDPLGTLWAVDNDPDGRPPCRLIPVAPGGDYGFEFRYGRTGMHPLQSWDAELPGTLGMVAGVGEAPCAVQWHDLRLLVTSWRDHVVQGFAVTPRGASYTAELQPVLTGGESFRPVGLAFAPDGAVYVTDWGSGSYTINGKGRVWKLVPAHPAAPAPAMTATPQMQRAAHLRSSEDVPELLTALDDPDSAIAQAAQYGLSQLPATEKIEWPALSSAGQKIGWLVAMLERGAKLDSALPTALKDPDDRVKQMAVRVAAEQDMKPAADALDQMLVSESLSPRLLAMTVAAIDWLRGGGNRVDTSRIDIVLLARLNRPQASDADKSIALHMLLASHPKIPMEELRAWTASPVKSLQTEAVRYLSDDADPARFATLATVAGDDGADVKVRADAVAGLANAATDYLELLLKLTQSDDAPLRQEALRSLRPVASRLAEAQRAPLQVAAGKSPADAALVNRLLGQPAPAHPPATDISAWAKVVAEAPGDPDAGLRLFFQPAGPGCFNCHRVEGRGRAVGPDLSMIGHSQTREHVLESILDPSREIAPLYTLWTITTKKGQRIDGMLLRRDGQETEVYIDASRIEIKVPEPDIVDRKIRRESLMPTGLEQGMTDQELRDLISYLTLKR